MGVEPTDAAPLVASAGEFVLEGLWAQKKIGRSDDRGFVAPERRQRHRARPRAARAPAPDEEAGELAGSSPWPSSATTATSASSGTTSNLEELVGELSDFLLQSGFGQEPAEWDEDSLQALHDAILEALMRRGLLSDEDLQKLMDDQDALDQFLQKTVERLVREGYLRTSEGQPFHDPTGGGRLRSRGPAHQVRADREGRSTSWATRRSAISWALSASRPSAATTPATSPPASRPRARPSSTSSATP